MLRTVAALSLLWSSQVQPSELLHNRFRSERLAREVAYTLLLPDDARRHVGGPAPRLIYLLHGAGGDELSWVREGRLAPALAVALREAGLPDAAVVMPSLGPHSWWIDGAVDAAASAFAAELIPRVEAALPFAVQRSARAIAGVSMGGFGALHLALKHPQLFCAAALISPAVYDPLPPAHSAARRSAQFTRDSEFDEGLWSAASHPAQWTRYRSAPDRVAFWIVAGDHDDLGIALASAQLFERLRALQPDRAELRIIDGGHDGPTFDAAMAPALGYLDRRCRP